MQRQSTKNKEYCQSIRDWHTRYHNYRDMHPDECVTQESYAMIEPKPKLTKFQKIKQVAPPITTIPNVLLIENSTVNGIDEDIDCSTASHFDTQTLSSDETTIDFVQVIATYQSKQFSTNRELVHFWHEALGHPNMEQMITIADQHTLKNWCKKLTPTVIRKFFPKNCASCIAGNLATSPSPSSSSSNESTIEIGHSIQIDLFCPLDQDGKNPLKSRTGHKYALLAVDTASRFTISKTFKSRKNLLSHLQDIVKQYKQRYKNIHQIDFHGIKNIKFDNEFKQDEIISYLKNEGIFYQFAAPHEHDTIGIVERYNRTLQEMLTKTLHSSKCDSTLWPLILRDCVFKHNLRPRNGTSPHEQWFGHKFDIQKYPILPFGAQVMAHVPIKMQRKLKYKAIPTIVVGTNTYTPGGVLLYCPSNNRVITRRTFRLTNINPTYDKLFEATDKDTTDLDLLDILNNDLFPSQFTGVEPETSIPNSLGNSNYGSDLLSSAANNIPTSEPVLPDDSLIPDQSTSDNLSTTIPKIPDVPSTTTFSNTPQAKYPSGRNKRIILRSPKSHTIRYYDKDNFVNSIQNNAKTIKRYVSLPIPKTVDEVNRTPQALEWLQAIRTELQSIKERGCFIDIDETKLIPKDRIIDSKLVFDIRYNPDGSIKKFKCRLVARGDKQPWQTYDQTYADTMTSKSVNILLSIIADQDLEMSKLDVKTAFLNSPLNEELYLRRPKGVDDSYMKPIVKLQKCIYGLKQAAKAWQDLLDSHLRSIGFTRLISDNCTYVRGTPSSANYMILGVYVYDILIGSKCTSDIDWFLKSFDGKFELEVEHNPTSYLGLELIRNRIEKTIQLLQRGYIKQMIDRFHVDTTKKRSHTPLSSYTNKVNNSIDNNPLVTALIDQRLLNEQNKQLYQQKVGSLMYLAQKTRHDIQFAVNMLSIKTSKPTNADMLDADRVLRYVAETIDLPMIIRGGNGLQLYAMVDASYGIHQDRKSHTGISIYLTPGSASILSISKKQKCVCLSSTESEYVGVCDAFKHVSWCRMFLEEIGFKQSQPTIVYEDNLSAIHMLVNGNDKGKTKHIDIRYHYIREKIINEEIMVKHLPTENMISDIFTKALNREQFQYLRNLLMGIDTNVIGVSAI